jgi:hypothetical protein
MAHHKYPKISGPVGSWSAMQLGRIADSGLQKHAAWRYLRKSLLMCDGLQAATGIPLQCHNHAGLGNGVDGLLKKDEGTQTSEVGIEIGTREHDPIRLLREV